MRIAGVPQHRSLLARCTLAVSLCGVAVLSAACSGPGAPVTGKPAKGAEPVKGGSQAGSSGPIVPVDPMVAEERAAIALSRGAARRRGTALLVSWGPRRLLRYVDRLQCPPGGRPCVQHYYVGALGERPFYHVIERHFATLTDYLLVDSIGGAQIAALNIPQPSPDGRYWAIASPPGRADITPVIQMWRVDPGPRPVALLQNANGGQFHIRGWKAARTLDLRIRRTIEGRMLDLEASVEPREGRWALVDRDAVTGRERVTSFSAPIKR